MPQETNNLILGAAISLLSAIVILILTSVYHWIDKNRDRSWIIDDRKYQRRLEVLSFRLRETEKFINQLYDIAVLVSNYEIPLVIGKRIDKQEINKTFLMATEATRNNSSIRNLGDDDLLNLSNELSECVSTEVDIAMSLEEKIEKGEVVDIEIEKERVINFYRKVVDIRKQIIKRIDELSGFNN